MRFESICGGKATYIDIITHTCSNHQTLAYSGWYTFHESVFPGLAATLGATIMAGDCPRKLSRFSDGLNCSPTDAVETENY
jgi:hypothetical protein